MDMTADTPTTLRKDSQKKFKGCYESQVADLGGI